LSSGLEDCWRENRRRIRQFNIQRIADALDVDVRELFDPNLQVATA
jgi:hypothetical protein